MTMFFIMILLAIGFRITLWGLQVAFSFLRWIPDFIFLLLFISLFSGMVGDTFSFLFWAAAIYFGVKGIKKWLSKDTKTENNVREIPAAAEPIRAAAVPNDENSKILRGANLRLENLRRHALRLRNESIRSEALAIHARSKKILDTLRTMPEKIPSVRQFWNYYLPTLDTILEKYEKLEKSGVHDGETAEKVRKHLSDVNSALENLYQSLFHADKTDLQIEMDTVKLAMQKDGLLAADDLFDTSDRIRIAI